MLSMFICRLISSKRTHFILYLKNAHNIDSIKTLSTYSIINLKPVDAFMFSFNLLYFIIFTKLSFWTAKKSFWTQNALSI